ncbi:hypothetical protein DsansV1_C18g0149391 [Dioscorea sansibarensis]
MSCIHHRELTVPEARLSEQRYRWLGIQVIRRQSFPVSPITNGDVHRSTTILLIVVDAVLYNSSNKDDINPGLVEQVLHGLPHLLPLTLMILVRVIPWCVHESQQPRRPLPVHLRQIPHEPLVLRRAGIEVSVGAEHEYVHGATSEIKRVVKVGVG